MLLKLFCFNFSLLVFISFIFAGQFFCFKCCFLFLFKALKVILLLIFFYFLSLLYINFTFSFQYVYQVSLLLYSFFSVSHFFVFLFFYCYSTFLNITYAFLLPFAFRIFFAGHVLSTFISDVNVHE